MGHEGMLLAALISVALIAIAYFLGAPPRLSGDMGICFPSPNEWGLTPLWGWLSNAGVLLVTTLTLYAFNRQFNVVQGSDTVLTGVFAIMVSTNLWISGSLSSSGLLALSNLLCMTLLLGCYRKNRAAQELCVIGTIISLGSMIQYAFIFMIPVYIVGAALMKCLKFKTFIAYLMGLAAPYWVAVGLGIVGLSDFTTPTISNLFEGYVTRPQLFAGLVNVGLTALVSMILALTNMVKLYAGNTQRRLNNLCIDILGLAALLAVIFDAQNMVAYLGTLYLVAAVQIANLFALRNVYQGGRWIAAICVAYIAGFAVMMTVK